MSTRKKNTFHPVQRVFLPAAETDTVGCVESAMSFNEVIALEASHALQGVNILIDHKHFNANTHTHTHIQKRFRVLLAFSYLRVASP